MTSTARPSRYGYDLDGLSIEIYIKQKHHAENDSKNLPSGAIKSLLQASLLMTVTLVTRDLTKTSILALPNRWWSKQEITVKAVCAPLGSSRLLTARHSESRCNESLNLRHGRTKFCCASSL